MQMEAVEARQPVRKSKIK